MSVAFLVYHGAEKDSRRKSNSFDWNSNAGAYMVMDCLRRAGIEVGFCSPETAHQHKVVLVSLTSTFDVLNLVHAVGRLSTWHKRSFRVVVGGFGAQNVTPLRHYVDHAVFGRAEGFVADLVAALLKGRDFVHPSVMNLEAGLHPVVFGQADQLYQHELATQPKPYLESEIGCPRRCMFCHFTFARRHLKSHDKTFQGSWAWASKEVVFNRLLTDSPLKGRTRTALDGLSERLRFAFNKPYSDATILRTLKEVSLRWLGDAAWLKVYLIGSFPTESADDLASFEDTIRRVEAPGKAVYLTFHATPFRPSPLTPSAYLPATLATNWNAKSEPGRRDIIRTEKVRANWSMTMEGPFSHLQSLVVERATPDSDPLINTLVFSAKLQQLRGPHKIEALERRFDLGQYLREYHTSEQLPTWYLTSYTPPELVKKMARNLKARLGMPEAPCPNS
jgi:hypothetical protein